MDGVDERMNKGTWLKEEYSKTWLPAVVAWVPVQVTSNQVPVHQLNPKPGPNIVYGGMETVTLTSVDVSPWVWVLLIILLHHGKRGKVVGVAENAEKDRTSGAGRSSPPFHRGYTSSLAISSQVHFVTSHFVSGTLRRLLFHRGDTSSPAVSSRGHFVTGARRREWNSSELEDNVTKSVQTVPSNTLYMVG